MSREEIIAQVRKFFDVDELVCDHTFAKWGERSWQFLDTDFLHCLLIIRRDILGKPMYANGRFAHQKGLRCNRCQLVREKNTVYLSSHVLGKAGDFTITGMTAEQARQLIRQNAALLPCRIRMENGVSWLHFDTLSTYGTNDKITLFNA